MLMNSPLSLFAIKAMLMASLLFMSGLLGCGGARHGRVSALSAHAGDYGDLCEHRVPAEVCTRCEPSRAAQFKKVGDWCAPHKVPESQCFPCHPDLSFKPLPAPPENADLREVPAEVATQGFKAILAPQKRAVTVVDFWAIWCVPCRKTLGDLHLLLAHDQELAVRKVEIKSWDDPLVSQYLAGTAELPLTVVFDQSGAEIGRVSGYHPKDLELLIKKAHR